MDMMFSLCVGGPVADFCMVTNNSWTTLHLVQEKDRKKEQQKVCDAEI